MKAAIGPPFFVFKLLYNNLHSVSLLNIMTTEDTFLLDLLKVALGRASVASVPEGLDWDVLFQLSSRQGVSPMVYDGIQRLGIPMDEVIRYKWIGMVGYHESRYARYIASMARLADFYRAQGAAMMVLKGYGLSLNYPIPNHRPMGDLDIYLTSLNGTPAGKNLYKVGDKALKEIFGIKVDDSHHHHSVFHFEGIMVENHYDFINTYAHYSSRMAERYLKEWVQECPIPHELNGVPIQLPPCTFNALFILRHSASHFAAINMPLRHILDWTLFVEHHGHEIDWNRLMPVLEKLNLLRFCAVINTIGVRFFGFDENIFPVLTDDDSLVQRVLEEVLSPGFSEQEKGSLTSALWVKPRRWWHNRWKNRLCYSDSLVSTFVHSFHAKIVKPDHFRRII